MFRSFNQSPTSRKFFTTTLAVTGLLSAMLLIKGWQPAKQAAAHTPVASAKSLLAPVPTLDLNVLGMEFPSMGLIGEKFCYTARIMNTGINPATDVGYNPYIQLILPPDIIIENPNTDVGLPGVCTGPSCNESSSYPIPLPASFTCTTSGGCLNHLDQFGVPANVPQNYTLWVIQPPIGSLYPGEPGIDVKICLRMKDTATLGALLPVCHKPIFQYGPNFGAPVQGIQDCRDVMPAVVKLTKRALNYTSDKPAPLPTVEVPTGSCNAVTYELIVNIADSKTLTGISIQDQLPNGMTLVPNSVNVLGASFFNNCTSGNFVCVNGITDTGAPGTPPEEFEPRDVVVQYQAYVNDNVLNPTTCGAVVLTNTATLDAFFLGVGPQHATAQLLIEVEHVTLQKTANGLPFNPADPLHVIPGQTVEYNLNFQVSGNVAVDANTTITDRLPDGIAFQSATLACGGAPVPISPSIGTPGSDGSVLLTFNPGAFSGCNKCTIRYLGTVLQTYPNAPLAGQPVRASDSLFLACGTPALPINCTKINYNIVGGEPNCSDDAAGGVFVKPVLIKKSIDTPIPPSGFLPGDEVTFRLTMEIPSGDTKGISFTDFLPSPVFNVATNPPFGFALDIGHNVGGTFNTPIINASDNSVTITFPDVTTGFPPNPSPVPRVEIRFKIKITTIPFPDDLYLTNLFKSKTLNSLGTEEGHLTGVVLHVRAPKLKITKGVFCSLDPMNPGHCLSPDNPNAVLVPPVLTSPVNNNIIGVDAGDQITFYLTVKNEGGAPAYGVVVKDFLPPCFKYESFMVLDGPTPPAPVLTGTLAGGKTVTFTYLNTQLLLPGVMWRLKVVASLPPHASPPNEPGCTVGPQPCQSFTNNSQVGWSSFCDLDNPNCVPSTQFTPDSDAATVTTAAPTMTKTVQFVQGVVPTTSPAQAAIGQQVFYKVEIRVPEASFTNFVLTDNLPPGLKLDGVCGAPSIPASVTHTKTIFTCASGGTQVKLDLGNVTNTDTNNATNELVSFTFGAIVLNETSNVNGVILPNIANLTTDQCNSSSTVNVKVVEPKLKVAKTVTPATADAGDTLTYTVTVMHDPASMATAWEAQLTDVIPAGQTYQQGSLMFIGCTATQALESTTGFTINWASLPLGTTCSFKFTTTLNASVTPCSTYANTANLTWTSVQGSVNIPINNIPNACERTGQALCGQLNNYLATGTATGTVPGPKITKSFSTTLPDTLDTNVTIGEEVCYTLKVELPEGVTPSLTVKDVIPAGLGVTSVSGRVFDVNGIPIANIPFPSITGSVACPNVSGGTVMLNYGAINVPVDGNTTNNSLSIIICAKVCDMSSNNMGMPNYQTPLTNTAMVQVGNAQPPTCFATSNPVILKVVEPKLTIKKLFDPATVKEGDMTTITLMVKNEGLSTAYNVNIEDPIPLWLFDNASITTNCAVPSGFTFSKPIVGTNSVVTFTGGDILTGQTLNFCFKGTVKRRCQMDMFNNIAKIKQAWTLPPPDCAPNCTRPAAPQDNVQGRDESGAVGEAKLTITPALDCTCFGFADATGIIRPPSFANMVEWLKFDEATGDAANDSSSFNNHGMLVPAAPNGPMHVADLVNNSLMFDGVDDSVVVPDKATLNFGTGNFAMDAWINPDPVSVSPTSGNRTILDKRDFSITILPFSLNFTGYRLFLSNGRLALQLADGNSSFDFISTATIAPNMWTHVAASVTRTSTSSSVIFYVDGVGLSALTTNTITGSVSNSGPLYIGRSIPIWGDYFTGKIDEVELFNIAPEHTFPGIYNAGKFGKCLPTPPAECCGVKPQFQNGNYPAFTGQVALVTCYANGGTDPVMAAIDLQNQAAAEANLLDLNWSSTTTPQTAFYHPAGWIRNLMGTVFGLTLDNTGNVFVAASSVYQRVPTLTIPVTLKSYRGTAGPGGVYKIDHLTANPTPFVTTLQATVYALGNQLPNFDPLGVGAAGTETKAPGLGNLAFDCARNLLYVSNFEDGRIYRINASGATGTVLGFWDHGANLSPPLFDDGATGMTAPSRRVWAVKTYNNRLYYSVWKTDSNKQTLNQHNEIWSIGLDTAGAFVGAPQLEISVPYLTGKSYSSPVSDISFMPNGSMLLAERSMDGDPDVQAHQARVLEYVFGGSPWLLSSKVYEIGRGPSAPAAGINAAGGVDFDRTPNGRVWATGDALHFGSGDYIYGLQGMPAGGTAGLNTMKSLLIDVDENLAGGGVSKFQLGDVQIPCPTNPCVGVTINITSPAMLPVATAGQNFTSPQFTASGGTPGYMFSATGLPMGLTMSMNGVISGISMQPVTSATVTVTAKDANGCMGMRIYNLTVNCAMDIAITPATLPNGMIGMAYSQQLTATGGCGTFTYAQVGGILPPGLTLSPSGVLAGTPTTCCDFTFTIKATDKCGCMQTMTYTVIIEGVAVSMTGLFNTGVNNSNVVLANGATDTHYSLMKPDTTFDTTKVLAPPLFGVPWLANNLISKWIGPSGLAAIPPANPMDGTYTYRTTFELPSCTSLTGVINGQWAVDDTATMSLNGVVVASLPTQLNTNFNPFHPFSITSGFQSGTNELVITVNKIPSPGLATPVGLRIEMTGSAKCCPCQLAIGPDFLPVGTAGTAYQQTLQPYGGVPSYTFTLLSGNLPPGVTFTNGVLSGTPTTPGSYTFTVKLTDATGCMTTRIYTIFIGCQLITFAPETFRAGIAGVAYTQALTQTGGVGTVTYSRIGGLLPPGLTLSNTGVLSGTPTAPGVFNFTLKATDANGCTATRTYAMETVCRTITINQQTIPSGSVGVLYNQTLTATGSVAPYTFTRIGGSLPPGLTLSGTGTLSGTPTTGGGYNFTVMATDGNGCTGTQSYSLVICGPIAISPATLPNGFVGTAYNQTFTQPDILAVVTWSVNAGNLPNGLTLNADTGVLAGTPTAAGSFSFTIKVTDANGCMGTRQYTVIVSGNGLQYYPLPTPVRLYDTRAPIAGFNPCAYLSAPVPAGGELVRSAFIPCTGIPNTARAIVGNATVIFPNAAGFVTIYPDGQARPPVSNLNFVAGQVVPNAFTVSLDTQGEFRLYTTAQADFAVDVTGYFAPPGSGGLYYHPLPKPIRLYDTRPPIPGFVPCEYLSQPLSAGGELLKSAFVTNCGGVTIPNNALAITGNATVIFPSAGGFVTIYPDGQARPPVSNLNFAAGQVVPNAFTVGLDAQGEFRLYTTAGADFAVDITGYYSSAASDANGAGLLYTPLGTPFRLYDTRTPIAGFTPCEYLSAPIPAGGELVKTAHLTCQAQTIPALAQAIVGNATIIFPTAAGFATIYPDGQVRPPVSNLNYLGGQVVPNAFTVSLNGQGRFRLYTTAQGDFAVDVTGYYAP